MQVLTNSHSTHWFTLVAMIKLHALYFLQAVITLHAVYSWRKLFLKEHRRSGNASMQTPSHTY